MKMVSLFDFIHFSKVLKVVILLTALAVCTCSTETKGRTIEIVEKYNYSKLDEAPSQIKEQIIEDNDIVKRLDKVSCCKLEHSYVRLTSKLNFNGTPFQIAQLLDVRCISHNQFDNNKECSDDEFENKQRKYVGTIIRTEQSIVSDNRRHLAGVVDPTKCTATGTGVSTFNTNTQVTITMTAKDSTSTNVGVGNEVVFVEITNACTKGNNYQCVANAGRQTVLIDEIIAQMTDNHDGTYTYNYSVSRPGQITVSVLHYTNGGVYAEYFPNTSESGDNAYNSTYPQQINYPSSSNNAYPGRSTTVSANFYFRFKAPTTGTITFSIAIDDVTSMSVNNTQILSGGCCTTYSGTTNVIKNQFYRAKVTFSQGGGPWTLIMSWAYDSVSSVVPSTSLYYPTYITSAPIQVTVTCPSGYSTSTSAGYPQCITTCGDGYRVGSEACDDSNTTPNDGCSATCTVESGYTCTGGSGTSKDTCSKPVYTCPFGYTCTSGSCNSLNDCSKVVTSICSSDYSLSSFNRWMALSMWTAFIICFVLDLVVSCVTDKYPSGLYILLEHIQLITILPLAGSCFSSEVNGFFRLSRYSLLSFDFIDIKQLFYINSDYSQDNSVMNFIGFTSGSTIINIAGYLVIGLCIMFAEMLVFKLYKFKHPSSVDSITNTNGCVFKTASRLKNWMPFGAPLRYFLLGVVLVNTAGFDELNNYSDNSHRWSWWLTIFLLFFGTFIFSCTIFYIILSRDYQTLIESIIFRELVNGLKANRICKLYLFVFIIHRILIIMFIIIDMNLSTNNELISIICIQSIYVAFLLFVRPYNSVKSNINKIALEILNLIIIALMLSYINSSDWSSSTEYVFICIMSIGCYIPLVILFISIFSLMCRPNANTSISPSKQKNEMKTSIDHSQIGLNINISANSNQQKINREEIKRNFNMPKNHYNYEKPWINKHGNTVDKNNDRIYPQVETVRSVSFQDKSKFEDDNNEDTKVVKVGNRKIYLR